MAIILNDSFEKKEKNVSHAEHNSNPGNIKYYSGNTKKLSKTAQFLINKGFNIKPGSKAKDGGQFIWFANKEDGLKAAQLFWTEARTWPIYKDLTVDQALKKYSGSGYTAKELGINGTALLKDLSEAELANMMNKQIKREDRKVYDTLVEDKLIVEPTSKLTLDDYAESLFKGKELTPEIANEVKEFTKDRKGYAKKQLAKVSAEVEAISERDGRIIGENNEAFNELVKKYGEGVTRLAIEQYNEEPKAINEKLQSQIVSLQNEAIEIDKLNNTLSDIKSKVIKGDFKKVLAQRNKLNYERNQKIYKLENEYLDKKIANQEKQLSNVNLTGNERKAVQEEILSLRKSKQGLITRSKIPAKSYPQTVNDVRNELSQDLPNVLKKKVLAEIPFEEKKPTDAPKKDADEVGVIELTPEQIAEAENDNAGDEKKEKTKPTDDDFEDFLNNFAQGEIIKPDTFKYDKKDFKKELPLEAIGKGLLAIKGLRDANTEVPLRKDTVDPTILAYLAEAKRISQMGMDPKLEADAKRKIAESMQVGYDNAVRSSGGNRNLVLGAADALNVGRLKAVAEIEKQNIDIKNQAFEQYGKTLQYIDSFKQNIANDNYNTTKQLALEKRSRGNNLAGSAFAAMLEDIQYQKENGPGSANHMLMTQMQQKVFGQVHGIADNGQVGSKSYAEAQDAKIKGYQESRVIQGKANKILSSLSPENRKAIKQRNNNSYDFKTEESLKLLNLPTEQTSVLDYIPNSVTNQPSPVESFFSEKKPDIDPEDPSNPENWFKAPY